MYSVSSKGVAQVLGTSLDEQRIGTWLDGKPLYKKAVVATIPSNGEYQIPVGISGNFNIVSWRGNFFQGGYTSPQFVAHIPYTFIDETVSGDVINIYAYYLCTAHELIAKFYGMGSYAQAYFNGQAVFYIEYTRD